MADRAPQKGTNEPQQDATTDAGSAKAPPDTGDRELSDADLDRVSGGVDAVRPQVRTVLERSPSF